MKTILTLLCLGILVSCRPGIKILDSKDNMDQKEMEEGYLFYPRQGEIYLSNIEDLVGNYVVIEPGANEQPRTWQVGRAITLEGIRAITKSDLSKQDPPYKSRITGKFSGKLSFALGSINFKSESVYDVVLKKNNSASMPLEFRYIDDSQFSNIYQRLPQRFLEVVFITGIEYRTLSIKEYVKATAGTNLGFTAIQVNGDIYYSNEQINSVPIIYYTGILESTRFGDFDIQDSVFNKKRNVPQRYGPTFRSTSIPSNLILERNINERKFKVIRRAIPKD